MKNTYKDLISLFCASALKSDCKTSSDISLTEIFSLAESLGIWPYVFASLKDMYKCGKLNIEEDTFNTLNQTVIIKTVKASAQRMKVHKLIYALEKEGIDVIVLKGESLAHLYKQPSLRISSDTDLLIAPENEERAIEIIRSFEIDVHKKSAVSHHTRCISESTGLIELHTDVYEDYIDDLYFDNFKIGTDNPLTIKTDDGFTLKTLSANDGLYFLTFHYIKHFLERGCGLRQITDLLLYMKNYKNDIDCKKYEITLEKLNFKGLIANTIGIGIKYMGFDKNDFFISDFDDEITEKLLCDIIEGGAFGGNGDERKRFNEEFLKIKLKKGYTSHKLSFMAEFFKKSASFSFKNISMRYPYIKKSRLLLPIAYINHIWYIINAAFKQLIQKKPKRDDEFINERLELFKKMNII